MELLQRASAEDYENDIIKKHEDTIEYREKIFKDYLKTVGFNAEPVLLPILTIQLLHAIIKETQKEELNLSSPRPIETLIIYGKLMTKKLINTIQKEFENMDTIYIADGHHRSASSVFII